MAEKKSKRMIIIEREKLPLVLQLVFCGLGSGKKKQRQEKWAQMKL